MFYLLLIWKSSVSLGFLKKSQAAGTGVEPGAYEAQATG